MRGPGAIFTNLKGQAQPKLISKHSSQGLAEAIIRTLPLSEMVCYATIDFLC